VSVVGADAQTLDHLRPPVTIPNPLAKLRELAAARLPDPQAHHLRGHDWMRLGNFPAALADFETYLAQKPDVPLILADSALALALTGCPERAQARYERALQLAPDSARIASELAWFYLTCPMRSRNLPRALELARKAVELKPDDTGCKRTLGLALVKAGKYSEAVLVLNRLDGKDQTHQGIEKLLLALCHAGNGQVVVARRALDAAEDWRRREKPTPFIDFRHRQLRAEAEAMLLDRCFPAQPFAG
jgi:Flp pilus assembly protein TadD